MLEELARGLGGQPVATRNDDDGDEMNLQAAETQTILSTPSELSAKDEDLEKFKSTLKKSSMHKLTQSKQRNNSKQGQQSSRYLAQQNTLTIDGSLLRMNTMNSRESSSCRLKKEDNNMPYVTLVHTKERIKTMPSLKEKEMKQQLLLSMKVSAMKLLVDPKRNNDGDH